MPDINYYRNKLAEKQPGVLERYKYYEMKNSVKDFEISTPPQLRWTKAVLGWCSKAVDSIADRLNFRDFRNDNFGLNEIFQMNNPDVLLNNGIKGALISGCDFVYIVPDDTGFPRLQVIDGANATGTLDPITGLLTEGYAVLERDSLTQIPVLEAYFTPDTTYYIQSGDMKTVRAYNHGIGYPLLVPVIYRPDAVKPFGHSRITPACMSIQGSAARTIKRSEISAEFYSFPQKWVSGLDADAQKMDKWKATMASMLQFGKDSVGDHPIIGQFQQGSMAPHLDQLKMFASLFAGETGLTLDDLGFVTANPSSAEAIKASHETLRLTTRKAQMNFGTAFLNIGMVAACVRDGVRYDRSMFYRAKPTWYPVFDPDYAALSQIGDGAYKINQAIEGFFDKDSLFDLTGIEPAEV